MILSADLGEKSVIGSGLSTIPPALQQYGVQDTTIFATHKIDLNLVSDPAYRIPVACSARLWNAAAELAGDDAFGLAAGCCAHPTMYHALGMALWSSGSYRSLFETWIRHLPLISMAGIASFTDKGTYYEFRGHTTLDNNGNPDATDIAIDATLGALISIARLHGTADFAPSSVSLMRRKPYNAEAFQAFFNCPVNYAADCIVMHFDKSLIDAPIGNSNPILMREMERLCTEYRLRMDQNNLRSRLRKVLLDHLPDGGAYQESIASVLHMSARTLHRKLCLENTSYRQELDDVRKQLSLEYMKYEKLSIMDVAFQLGFSNGSNFSRAFKRWVGKTPHEYRIDSLQDSDL